MRLSRLTLYLYWSPYLRRNLGPNTTANTYDSSQTNYNNDAAAVSLPLWRLPYISSVREESKSEALQEQLIENIKEVLANDRK